MARNSIKKGTVINPKGRPKGSMNELKRKSMELRQRALQDVTKAYKVLWEAFEAKESWAHQLYFKELVPFKKEWLSEVNTSNVPKELKSLDDVNHVLAALTNTLLQESSMPTEEVHSLIKTINSIKFTEQFGKQSNALDKLSDEQVRIIAGWLEEEKGV